MRAAIFCGGSSLISNLPETFDWDVIVAVNDAAALVPWHHWAAVDTMLPKFRAKFPDWRKADWTAEFLFSIAEPEFPAMPRYTFPLALKALLTVYKPDTVDAYGVDFGGVRVDGVKARPSRWEDEAAQVRRLDLSRITWRGEWRP